MKKPFMTVIAIAVMSTNVFAADVKLTDKKPNEMLKGKMKFTLG